MCDCKEQVAFEMYKILVKLDGQNPKVPDDDTVKKHLDLFRKCLDSVRQVEP